MSWNSIAQNRKQAQRRKESWGTFTDEDGAGVERRSRHRHREQPADNIDRWHPSIHEEAARSFRDTHSAPRVETQRQALLDLRARLHGNVTQPANGALGGCGIEASCGSPDNADRAGEIAEQDVAVGLLGSVGETTEQIEAALQRIEDGSYGRCVECDTRIPAVRLEAIPYATCCVQCAARRERA